MGHRIGIGMARIGGLVAAALTLVVGLASTEAKENAMTPERRGDIVQARQLLMDAIEEAVPPLDAAAAGQPVDLMAAGDRAYLINTLLVAFPHLFPDGTKPDQLASDGLPSNALPVLWDRYDEFYALSRTAAAAALDASQAKDQATLARYARALREACDACHASFMANLEGHEHPHK